MKTKRSDWRILSFLKYLEQEVKKRPIGIICEGFFANLVWACLYFRVFRVDFALLFLLTAYGKVFLVRKRGGYFSGNLYAMKVLKKATIVQKAKTAEHTRTERQVLEAVRRCPFLVTLHWAFQTESKLHLIMGRLIRFVWIFRFAFYFIGLHKTPKEILPVNSSKSRLVRNNFCVTFISYRWFAANAPVATSTATFIFNQNP